MAVSRKHFWRRIGLGIGVFLLILLGMAQLFKRDLLRLQFVLSLFSPSTIAENFRRMPQVFGYRAVRPNGPTYRIPYESKPLPEAYMFQGRRRDLHAWLGQTATTGFIVIHDGKIAFERYYLGNDVRTKWPFWSASAPMLSALIGIAMEEGLIRSVSDFVTDYTPRLKISGYHGVTLKDVLQMSSGIAFDGSYADFTSDINRLMRCLALGGAIDDHMTALERARLPGTFHHPVCADTQALAMMLREATGRPLTAYMEEKLWSRLGTEAEAVWLVDDTGTALTFFGTMAVLRDFARFGLLYLNTGKNFRGQQIVPAAWIRASVIPDRSHLMPGADNAASTHPHGYGYQWWVPGPLNGDYYARGDCGQYIYVNPSQRVVIVKTSADAGGLRSESAAELESIAAFRAIAAHMAQAP